MGNIAVFLDRDGTVNEEVDFLTSPRDLHLIPRSAEAIRKANDLGLRVFIVTNQSGVARGLLSENDLLEVHRVLTDRLLEQNARVDRIYYCPHHPDGGIDVYRRDCDCRKPKTGMIDRAVREYKVDPGKSYVIGDRTVDVGMAKNAGAHAILVLTGYGRAERELCERDGIPLDYVADDLYDAMEFVAGSLGNEPAPRLPMTPVKAAAPFILLAALFLGQAGCADDPNSSGAQLLPDSLTIVALTAVATSDTNYLVRVGGNQSTLLVGTTPGYEARSLLRFSFASFDTTSRIDSGVIEMQAGLPPARQRRRVCPSPSTT